MLEPAKQASIFWHLLDIFIAPSIRSSIRTLSLARALVFLAIFLPLSSTAAVLPAYMSGKIVPSLMEIIAQVTIVSGALMSLIALRFGNGSFRVSAVFLTAAIFISSVLMSIVDNSSLSSSIILLAIVPFILLEIVSFSAGVIGLALFFVGLIVASYTLPPFPPEPFAGSLELTQVFIYVTLAMAAVIIFLLVSVKTYLVTLDQHEIEAQNLELEKLNEKLAQQAIRDGLTGLYNRRYFDEQLDLAWRKAARSNDEPVTIVMIDVDFFKPYNDNYGHTAGDECLIQVAEIIKNSVSRAGDIAARYGGEEFVLLLPNVSTDSALELVERIRKTLTVENIAHQHSPVAKHVTFSAGISQTTPSQKGSLQTLALLNLADTGLYAAKEAGRNRSVVKVS